MSPTKNDDKAITAMKIAQRDVMKLGARATAAARKAANDGMWSVVTLERAAQGLREGSKSVGVTRPWPRLAAGIERIVKELNARLEKSRNAGSAKEERAATGNANGQKGKKRGQTVAKKPSLPSEDCVSQDPPRKPTAYDAFRDDDADAIESKSETAETAETAETSDRAPKVGKRAARAAEFERHAKTDGTLANAIMKHMNGLSAEGATDSTGASYLIDLRLAMNHFGMDRDVSTITRQEFDAYVASDAVSKRRDGTPKNAITTNKIARSLRMCLARAGVEWATKDATKTDTATDANVES